MSTVSIRNVSKAFGESVVLREFNETFGDGEFVTLLGPSGCGKTTMLRIIAGFEKPTTGELYIDDQLVSGGKTFVPPEKRSIGMVFQSYAVWPHMNVFDNVAYPLVIKKQNKEQIRERVNRALEIVHLTKYANRFPNQMSGGQQQRVALARALVAAPKLLLLDEPLSNLDAKLRESMRFEIKDIQKQLGITVVYVTHDQTEAMAMSDRIFLINRGIVQQSGTPQEIYNQPVNQFVADFLGKVDFFKGEVKNGRIELTSMGGQSIPYDGPRTGKVEVAIRPENLYFASDGPLKGKLEIQYYLGDVDDCRVRIGDELVRVIASGYEYYKLQEGQEVSLGIRDFLVFDDDGMLDQMLTIQT
ncbi:MAG: ABC transporter ATP-binding protein [Clostridia bacterium]|nr:ABC transporter ATP-binding protein [Clostridia bacterium]MBQ6232275.1 ABC transporter ATP-binding protein [Clostridia bacterium]